MEVCKPLRSLIAFPNTYAVDSLVAVEVRNWLIRELQADISVFDILGTIPISALAVKIVETSKLLANKFDAEKQDMGIASNGSGEVGQELEAKTSGEKVEVGTAEVLEETLQSRTVPVLDVKLGASEFKWRVVDVAEEIPD